MKELFLTLLGAVFGFALDEVRVCLPWLTKKVMAAAEKGLPANKRERLIEEWRSIIEAAPGEALPFINACSFWYGVSKERLRVGLSDRAYAATMRTIDIVASVCLLVFCFPLYSFVFLSIRATMGKQVHIYEVRYGKDGKPFRMYVDFHPEVTHLAR